MKLIFDIFLILTLVLATYYLCILLIHLISRKSIEEATQMINQGLTYLLSVFQSPDSQPCNTYPVCIAYNGYSVSEDSIHESFRKLDKLFEIWFFEVANVQGNTVFYQFKAFYPLESYSRRKLLSLCRHIGENVLSNHFHQQGFYNFKIDFFVAVTLNADTLRFYFPLNEAGLTEISNIKKQFH